MHACDVFWYGLWNIRSRAELAEAASLETVEGDNEFIGDVH